MVGRVRAVSGPAQFNQTILQGGEIKLTQAPTLTPGSTPHFSVFNATFSEKKRSSESEEKGKGMNPA